MANYRGENNNFPYCTYLNCYRDTLHTYLSACELELVKGISIKYQKINKKKKDKIG